MTNPVGLGAGFDKDGEYIDECFKMGFGFVEIGTVTPKPQSGNPQPRVFRIPEYCALINRMGFNNNGVENLVENVINYQKKCDKQKIARGVIGINIGKNAITPMEDAILDYQFCLDKAFLRADYIAINISSPNTKNLRQLQSADSLKPLLESLRNQQIILEGKHNRKVPMFIKVAPDLDDEQIALMSEVFSDVGIEGIITTNTTIGRENINHPLANETGGLSGLPLKTKSDAVLAKFHQHLPTTVFIGVGGINSVNSAIDKKRLGAKAVQLYSGFIYEGTKLITDISRNWDE